METLSAYIKRVMSEKDLKRQDVLDRSNNEISAPYLNDLLGGRSEKLGPDKIIALSKGLDTDAYELLLVAAGQPVGESKDDEIARRFRRLETKFRAIPPEKRVGPDSALRVAEGVMDDIKRLGGISNGPVGKKRKLA